MAEVTDINGLLKLRRQVSIEDRQMFVGILLERYKAAVRSGITSEEDEILRSAISKMARLVGVPWAGWEKFDGENPLQ